MAAAVDAWADAHRAELVQDLISLVAIPSVSGEPACLQAMTKLTELGERYGFAHETNGEWCTSILLPGTENTRELGMLGHLDVVPAGDGWHSDPFCVVEKDGYVIGRGSSDNKGPVIMCLYVLRCLNELRIPFRSTVRLIAGCREETDMLDVHSYLQTHEPPAFTLNCDGAWALCIGEKGILEADLTLPVSAGNLVHLSGGTVSNTVPDRACAVLISQDGSRVTIETHGKAAHCCVPHQGENAIRKLLAQLRDEQLLEGDAAAAISTLCSCFPDDYGTGLRINHQDALSGKTTCVPSLISMEGGMIRLRFNARTALTQRREWLMNALSKRLAKMNVTLENLRWLPPRSTSQAEPEVRLLLDTCRQFLNPRCKPYTMGGATHSRVFPRSIPFGPAVLDPRVRHLFGKAHGPDEAVCIEELLRAIKVYIAALKRLDDYFAENLCITNDI